jgi:enamine deaminase RidA (YjgF/YER057c/UK114 family)
MVSKDNDIKSLIILHDYASIGCEVVKTVNGTDAKKNIDRAYETVLEVLNAATLYGYPIEDLVKVAIAIRSTGTTAEELMKKTVLAETLTKIYKQQVDSALKNALTIFERKDTQR